MANLPPATADGRAVRGGTMLDHLQVTVTPTGEHVKLPKTKVTAIRSSYHNYIIKMNSSNVYWIYFSSQH